MDGTRSNLGSGAEIDASYRSVELAGGLVPHMLANVSGVTMRLR